jgi:hypothetical protein
MEPSDGAKERSYLYDSYIIDGLGNTPKDPSRILSEIEKNRADLFWGELFNYLKLPVISLFSLEMDLCTS